MVESIPKTECDDCGYICLATELNSIEALWSRSEQGNPIPAGQCPKCGALSYLATEPTPPPHLAEYLAGNCCCPFCGGGDNECLRSELVENVAYYSYLCLNEDCHNRWTDEYMVNAVIDRESGYVWDAKTLEPIDRA